MSTDQSECLTYVIPTHNRPEFLDRLLRYMAMVQCRNKIQIADSSSEANAAINLTTFQKYRAQLRLDMQHYDLGVIQKCSAAVDQVRTRYAAFVADDDFQFPQVADKCTGFLDQNADFGTCLGRTAVIHAGAPTVRQLDHRTINAECPLQRCFELSLQGNYSTFYGIHRTSLLRERFQLVVETTDYQRCRILPEIMLAQLCALQGKIGVIPETSLLKLSHGRNETCLTPRVQNPDQATKEFGRYRAALSTFMLNQVQGSEPTSIGRIIDRNFRLMYPAPLFGGHVMVNRWRREFRKLGRHATRARYLGVRYLSEQKGYHVPIHRFSAVARQHTLAVQMINSAEKVQLPSNRAA